MRESPRAGSAATPSRAPCRTAPAVTALSPAEIAYHTASARRYGFHATLKAPFVLADGKTEAELDDGAGGVCRRRRSGRASRPGACPARRLPRAGAGRPSPDLDRFAGEIVRALRTVPRAAVGSRIRRRNPDALSQDEFRNLCQWGYPYVFDAFRFHMTLTGRVADHDLPRVRAAIDEVFAPVLAKPVSLDGLALFVEPEPGAPFVVKSWHAAGPPPA